MKKTPHVTLPLALFDALPVIFFFLSCTILAERLKNINYTAGTLFRIGGIISFIAGSCQVFWKLIIVLFKKNIYPIHAQMKYTMPLGFLIMIGSVVYARKDIQWSLIKSRLFSMPCLFFILTICLCIVLMFSFIFTLNHISLKTHWIEECVNVVFQGSVLLCTIYAGKEKSN